MMLYILLFVLTFPLILCLSFNMTFETVLIRFHLDIPYVIDVMMSFFTGYYNDDTRMVVLGKRQIIKYVY